MHWYSFRILDIDECAREDVHCEGGCTNLPGSYRCGCDTGFKKEGDRCEGLFNENNDILQLNCHCQLFR